MINTKQNNITLPQVTENITRWHHDRNLIEGATTWTQSKKLLEEFIELVAAQMPEQKDSAIAQQVHDWIDDLFTSGRIKSVTVEDAAAALKDAIGDMDVVSINIAEREGFTKADAAHTAYTEIKDRTGRMVNGTFVREADLHD